MMNYTIDGFWKPRLPVIPDFDAPAVRGWSFLAEGLQTFKEAPLTIDEELGTEALPEESSILLVSAPGAVGKSTLARQIGFATGAVYVDLGAADPVGGNTLSGGLVRSRLYASWEAQTTTVLIDGLDEARLRVTQEAFAAFLSDVAALAAGRKVPIVLFGRTGSIQDAWLMLLDHGVKPAVLEIGYYGAEASLEFAEARLRVLRPNEAHRTIERKALQMVLARLRGETETDGDRFAGYAPVLQAIADRVARENNPAGFVADLEKGAQSVTLATVVSAILEREHTKLEGLPFEDASLRHCLYKPSEQLDRLVARQYGFPPPILLTMGAKDTQTYSRALESWVGEHPFLKRRPRRVICCV